MAASHGFEHVTVFVAVGVLLGAADSRRRLVPVLWLVMFCCWVEFIQLWVPGRHARVADRLVDVIGGLTGMIFGVLASLMAERERLSRSKIPGISLH